MAFRGIGMAGRDQALDHRDDLRDVRGRGGFDVGRGDAEGRHVLAVGGGEAIGDHADRRADVPGGGVDLVVDVGDVAGVAQRAVAAAQQRGKHAEDNVRTRIADVHVVVDRRPADVHRRAGRIERHERFELARQVVVKVQAHRLDRWKAGQF